MPETAASRSSRPGALEIVVARHAGFCFGVERAVELVRRARAEHQGPLATLGPLIHNPQVVAQLNSEGIGVVSSVSELSGGSVIIPSHGVVPAIHAEAAVAGVTLIDATCPFVYKAQRAAQTLAAEGYRVIMLGDRGHPEVSAVLGHAGDDAVVIETPTEARGLPEMTKAGLLVQTTQTLARLRHTASALADHCQELRVFNTICGATQQRQEAAIELARWAEVMLVVGGRISANTARLREVCQETGAITHHIETPDEIEPAWFAGRRRVGITAGASTPQSLIEGTAARVREIADRKRP
jgi:(E)-4-hydroxy-3-methyl-but-2-enyl pyrophosphate reductase